MTHPTEAPMQAVFLLVPYYPSQGEDNPGTWDWSSLVGDDVRHLHPLEVVEEVREYVDARGFELLRLPLGEYNKAEYNKVAALQKAVNALNSAHHWMQEAGLMPDE